MPFSEPLRRHGWVGFALLAAALALSACGRAGPLEPPPAATPSPAATKTPDASADPAAAFRHPKSPPITPPTRALPIDPLL